MYKYQLQEHKERQERVKQAVKLWKNGLKVSQIARKLKVANTTTEGYLLENGINPYKITEPPKPKRLKRKIKTKCPTANMLLLLIIIICLLLILITF